MSTKLQAADITHMFEVSLPVVSQEAEIRKASFEQGLIEVSVRISGTSLAPTQIPLADAAQLISQYHYRALSDQEVNAYLAKAPTLIPPRFILRMEFDDEKVKRLLRENGLPHWGYQRPNVLVWLAVKDGRNRYILKQTDQSQIKNAIEKGAKGRGLPIVWPKLDITDQKLVEFTDIWGQFWEPIKQASKRYAVDTVILGRMSWENNNWRVDWSLLQEDKIENWSVNAVDLAQITNSGIGVATDSISSRFSVFADSSNDATLIVRINNLASVKDYAEALHYLASLAPVKNVYPKEVNQHQVDFFIDLNGDQDDLKRIIALGNVLLPDIQPVNMADPATLPQNNLPRILQYNLGS